MKRMRLRCGGKAIMNCLQLYESANIVDLLAQEQAFCAFASAHCTITRADIKLVNALKKVSDGYHASLRELLSEVGAEEHLQEQALQYYAAVCSVDCVHGDEQLCIRTALIGMLSHLSEDRICEQLSHMRTLTVDPALLFGNDSHVTLSEGEYTVAYQPGMPLADGETIRTFCLTSTAATGTDVYLTDPSDNTTVHTIPLGSCANVNVVDQTIVRWLPERLRTDGHVLERIAEGKLRQDGKLIQGTSNVSSFAASEGYILWVSNGFPYGNVCDPNDPKINMASGIVEVALQGSIYYLLRRDGMVITNHPIQSYTQRGSSLEKI